MCCLLFRVVGGWKQWDFSDENRKLSDNKSNLSFQTFFEEFTWQLWGLCGHCSIYLALIARYMYSKNFDKLKMLPHRPCNSHIDPVIAMRHEIAFSQKFPQVTLMGWRYVTVWPRDYTTFTRWIRHECPCNVPRLHITLKSTNLNVIRSLSPFICFKSCSQNMRITMMCMTVQYEIYHLNSLISIQNIWNFLQENNM